MKAKSKGKRNLFVITGIAIIAIASAYFYLDYQADSLANENMGSLVDEAQSQGLTLRYSSVDASPLTQSIEITDFAVIGNEQEPDIRFGNVVVKGISWQDLNNNQNKFPLAMTVNVNNGELYLKSSMVESNAELQSMVRIFGNTIPFSAKAAYEFDSTLNLLQLSLSQTVEENFIFNGKILLGNTAWLTELEQQSTQMYADIMDSTLNSLSLTYQNTGLVEKIRAEMSKQTGRTDQQLMEESVAEMQQLQIMLAEQASILSPLIDEVIKFIRDPEQIQLNIDPIQPLSGQTILMAFLSGEVGFTKLIEDAQIKLKAN